MEAAEIYLDIYKNYTGVYDDRGMCEVLFNTAINLESARLVMKAIDVRKHMVAKYPECEHSKKASYFIGQNYHALQNFSKAAEYYVKFATKYEGEEEAPGSMSSWERTKASPCSAPTTRALPSENSRVTPLTRLPPESAHGGTGKERQHGRRA